MKRRMTRKRPSGGEKGANRAGGGQRRRRRRRMWPNPAWQICFRGQRARKFGLNGSAAAWEPAGCGSQNVIFISLRSLQDAGYTSYLRSLRDGFTSYLCLIIRTTSITSSQGRFHASLFQNHWCEKNHIYTTYAKEVYTVKAAKTLKFGIYIMF